MKTVHLGLKFIFLFESPNSELCSSSYDQNSDYCSREADSGSFGDLTLANNLIELSS